MLRASGIWLSVELRQEQGMHIPLQTELEGGRFLIK
jgi:hypothetical protein